MALKVRALAMLVVLAFVGTACAGVQKDEAEDQTAAAPSLTLGAASVEGNVATLPVTLKDFEIVKADGDTSGKTGHFHVFIDRDPIAVGEVIPKEKGIVHSADNPIKVWGLKPGHHEFTVVLGDGTHKRIDAGAEDSTELDVKGASVWGTVPATAMKGDDVTVELESKGVEIVKADGDMSGKTGHYHVLVDPATPPKAGMTIPEAKEGSVYHTTESSVTISDLAVGEHTIWIVLGDGTHMAFDPPVMDKKTVTVS
jgi:hypothetical protein